MWLLESTQNPFSVLQNTQYRLLFAGTTLAMLAFGMMQVVQGVVAFELTGKNSAVGFVFLGQGISMLFLSPVGGTLSDRISKKRLLTSAQFVIGAMFALIAVLIATDLITILILAGASLVLGIMYSIMGPTRQAWVGDLLQGDELARGVALQQLMMNSTRIVGPLLAGLLIATGGVGTAGTYFGMALLFAAVVAVLLQMAPSPPRPRAHQTSVRADLEEGFRYIWRDRDVRMLALVFVGIVLSGFSYQAIMPGYLENALGHPASHLGILYGAMAVGGIVVTLVLAAWPPRRPSALMLAFGAGLAFSLGALAVAPGFGVALAVGALVGAASSGFQMLNNVSLMQRSDPTYFGRVMAVTMMAFGVNSIVSYPVGLIADAAGERATLGGLAVACGSVVLVGVLALRPRRAVGGQPAVAPET
ncbi:MAG: MFS transporter [Chloroflexi bacterium]|nr:MFS transporter [Dehalococcoidia bacterium]MCO5200388.1 MFS transporter [Chloroflexota bacterium]MCZ7576049.1 MFS transporter [Dehalococcoidia bacterium]